MCEVAGQWPENKTRSDEVSGQFAVFQLYQHSGSKFFTSVLV